jgi:hypothetical protein
MKRATRNEWMERVRHWRASGLTAGAFAAREGLSASTLLWWSSKLKRDGRGTATFIEVVPTPTEPGYIEVVVREQVRIRVSGAFDAAVLRRVVAVLESA